MQSIAPLAPKPVSPRTLSLWLFLLWGAIFAIAVSGYPKLLDNERRVGGYVLDAVQNGHWIVQRDVTGDIASKPPLLTWIAALSTLCFGEINRFSIYLPSALATLGTALLLFSVGRKEFGWRSGFIAALIYLLSYVADSQVVTARYDGLFAFPVLLGAVAAYRAWTTGRGWTAFWAAVTLATMVKGPLGLVLSASGLLAALWQRREGDRVPLRGSHWLGIGIFILVCGGWFALAYWQMGPALVAKLFGRELVGHVVQEGEVSPGQRFWEPAWNTFCNFLPWSVAGLLATWRLLRDPAAKVEERRFERFLFCWVAVSIVFFSVAAHQRGRLVWPLVPAIALLAGREIERWLATISSRRLLQYAGALSLLVLTGLVVYHHSLRGLSRDVRRTLAMKELAGSITRTVGPQFPITFAMDAPFAVQFYLNTVRPHVYPGQAAALLRGEAAAFVLVRNAEKVEQLASSNVTLRTLYEWPPAGSGAATYIKLLSNRSSLEWAPRMATFMGPLRLELENTRIEKATLREFTLAAQGGTAALAITNTAAQPVPVRIRWSNRQPFVAFTLASGEGRRFTPDQK